MILVRKSKFSLDPRDNYTEAVCDQCKEPCPESFLPGRVGFKAIDDANEIAKQHGYVEREVQQKRGRRFVTKVELICPDCQRSGG
jgi:hypothetical protein